MTKVLTFTAIIYELFEVEIFEFRTDFEGFFDCSSSSSLNFILRIGFFNSAANELADRGVLTFGQILELLPHGLIKKNVGADV